jgi:hypothetical protein
VKSPLIALAVAAAAALATAGLASALSSPQLVTAFSPTNANDFKVATAVCPAGRLVSGGGGDIDGGFDPLSGYDPVLRFLIPGGSSWVTAAHEVDPTTVPWNLDSRALCIERPSGFQIVSASTASSSADFQFISVACPAGKVAVSGGALLGGPPTDIALRDSAPLGTAPPTSWGASGEETDPTTANWNVTAYAVCVDATAAPGVHVVLNNASQISDTSANAISVVAECPTGENVYGGGASILLGTPKEAIRTSAPQTTTSWIAAGEETDPDPASWLLIAYAICAPPS